MTRTRSGRIGPAFLVATVLAAAGAARAQVPGPPGGNGNPVCQQLEGQLSVVDRGGVDPARADQIRRYEDSAGRQQAELDRTVAQSRRMGCEGSGFFSLFSGQPQQCGELNSRIQQMHANLDQMLSSLQRLQGGTADAAGRRRGLINALAQNNCGPQYRQQVNVQPRGFFESLFNPGAGGEEPGPNIAPADVPSISGAFRTLCVRTCDGYFYPISFSAGPGRFKDDERTCQRTSPASEVSLYVHHNPGEDVAQAVSLSGKRYTDLPNAFRYRKEFTPTCSCRAAGQSWADALKSADDHVERGDVIVTEERARQLSAAPQGRPAKPGAKPDAQPMPLPDAAAPPAAAAPAPSDDSKRTIRAVGPTYIAPR
jgi:hypothetical protein